MLIDPSVLKRLWSFERPVVCWWNRKLVIFILDYIEREKGVTSIYLYRSILFAWHVLAKVVRFYHRIIITIMAKIQFWLQFPPWHGTGLYLTQHTYRFPTYFSPILASIELTLCFEWLARDTDHRIHFIHSILNLSKPKNSIKHRNITQNAGSSS